MDVEDAVWKRLEHRAADEPHESGEAYEADVPVAQLAGERPIEIVARRESAMADVERLYSRRASPIEARGVRAIRDYDSDLCVETTVSNGSEDRLEVAAPSGDEHAETAVHDRCM
jgi:hypothetical protein